MSFRPFRSGLAAGAATVALLALGVVPAFAHVEPTVDEIPAGTATTVGLTLEHGCDESPTTEVEVQVPAGADVAPVATDGWTTGTSGGVVTFTAEPGSELDAHTEKEFDLEITPGADAAGDILLLKTVQTCEAGTIRWIEEWDGQGTEPENPAPQVTVIAAGASATTVADHHEETTTPAPTTSSDSTPENGDSGPIVVVVVLLGLIGFGGVMLHRSRRSTP